MLCSINSQKDYRYDMEKDEEECNTSYLSPIDEISDKKIDKIGKLLSGTPNPLFEEIQIEPIPGRILKVSRACNGVCMYYFHELMEGVMGDSDFRAICKQFKAIIIRNMREIKRHERNTANRLIKLFDEAYYRNVKVYIEATVGIDDLIKPLPEK